MKKTFFMLKSILNLKQNIKLLHNMSETKTKYLTSLTYKRYFNEQELQLLIYIIISCTDSNCRKTIEKCIFDNMNYKN